MKDLIDERNERERISKSIIKYWNVNYVPVQPKAETMPEEAPEKEILEMEEQRTEEDFNETTGSYSGAYGRKEVEDEVTKGQIDKILHEKSETLRQIIDENKC
ncbi:MAG: hypothetical protein PUA75_05010 [Clostridiales bacterium]|nr:hypothetical protein [Clostridiales bacterium]